MSTHSPALDRTQPSRNDAGGILLSPDLLEVIAERVAELLAKQAPAAEPDPYLTVDQAAEYLACKPKRIYDLCSQHRVDCLKDGSRTLLRRADLDAYLKAST